MPADQVPDTKDPLERRTPLALIILRAIVAPIATGLALGAATIVGGEVLFGVFRLPPSVTPSLAVLFVLALTAVLLAGLLSLLSVKQ